MHFKLIIALVEDKRTDAVMNAAREAGATGATVISHARGEGVETTKTFLGLTLETQRDMLLFLVEQHLCRPILETIHDVGGFEKKGGGIAFQLDVEDAVGVAHQVEKLAPVVEEKL
ncbi:MAG: P-II family nitrogen regulator [Gammaproteobacteria bacterium]|nr:MAG: P-II family nitrogen regulator [Gammaproteobacteria bacterium]